MVSHDMDSGMSRKDNRACSQRTLYASSVRPVLASIGVRRHVPSQRARLRPHKAERSVAELIVSVAAVTVCRHGWTGVA